MTGTVCNKSWVNILKSNGGANDIRYFIMNIFIYKYLLTCTCFEQLWSVGAAPPGDPEAPHTPGLPSVPRYQSFFRGTSDFPGSHSAWPQHSHLTSHILSLLGWACLLCLSPGWQCLNVSVVSSLSSARPAPHHTRPVSWCQLRTEAAVSHWWSRPRVPDQASVESV